MVNRRPYHPKNPLPGISPAPTTAPGNQAVVPSGHGGRRVTLFYRTFAPTGAGAKASHPTANYSLLTANSLTYTFSAKEKDSETGLSYFGSRYYSSDLSIWLSVDPMSDKYPSLSPYVYCADNPVKLVDPAGEEIYEFDENGKFLRVSGAQGSPDQIAIIRADGKIMMSQEYNHGTIRLGLSGSVNQENGTPVDVQSLKINDDALALECFKFVADNSSVEWSLTRTTNSSGGQRSNFLSNSQEAEHENSLKLITGNARLRVREHWYSQPNGYIEPSSGNYSSAESLRKNYGNVFNPNGYIPTYIYSQGKHRQYSPFLKMIGDNIHNAWNEWVKEVRR